MKRIRLGGKLTRGKEIYALVDDEDFKRVMEYKWQLRYGRNTYYARRTQRTKGDWRRQKSLLLHRFILGLDGEQVVVDHINNNGLDNRKENLRLCSNQQNVMKQQLQKRNKYGFKGVRPSGKQTWEARIRFFGKDIHIGTFNSKDVAAGAYNQKAKELFKEFALLNYV